MKYDSFFQRQREKEKRAASASFKCLRRKYAKYDFQRSTKIIISVTKKKVSIVHLGEDQARIPEAEQHGVKSVPALVTPTKNVLHINFGASIEAVKA